MTRGLLFAGLAMMGGLVVGCTAEDNGPPPPAAPSAVDQEKAIAAIQNSSMSPQAKEQAIAGYKAGMARMGTQGTNPAPGSTPGK